MEKRNPNRIMLHHSLTEDNTVLSSFEAIKNYHMKTKGWRDIGYDWVLEYVNNKLVWREGRSEIFSGAHCAENKMNILALSFCIVGNFDVSKLNDEHIQMILQKQTECEVRWGRKLPLDLHRNHATYKSCPGKNVTLEMFDLYKDVSDWAKAAWIKAKEKGINDGFGPKTLITEEQLMVFFDRVGLLNRN